MWCCWSYSTVKSLSFCYSSFQSRKNEKCNTAGNVKTWGCFWISFHFCTVDWNTWLSSKLSRSRLNNKSCMVEIGLNNINYIICFSIFLFMFIYTLGFSSKKSNTSSHKRSCFRLLQLAATLWKEEPQAVLSYLRKEYYCYAEAFVIVVVVRHTFE